MAERLTEMDGQFPPLAWHADHYHVAPVLSLGTVQDDVGPVLLDVLAAA